MSGAGTDSGQLLRQPTFLIFGAQKSGTTSLHNYLDRHPAIFMSKPLKEPGYYWSFEIAQRYWGRRDIHFETREELLGKFMLEGYGGQKEFGESSSYYTIGNYCESYGIPALVKAENPEVKFIYMMRNPIGRIVSSYLHSLRGGLTTDSLNEFIFEKVQGNAAIGTSLYHRQLMHYVPLFGLDRFKCMIFEEFVQEPQGKLDEIFEFLEVEPFDEYASFQTFNPGDNRDELGAEELKLSAESYESVTSRVLPDCEELKKLLDLDFSVWDLSAEAWS